MAPRPSSWQSVRRKASAVERLTGDLAEDLRPPRLRVLERLEHKHPAPLAQYEPVAVTVERAAGAAGLVVAGQHRGQEDEACQAEGVDHAVDAAREHHVGGPIPDQLRRLADRLGTGRACGQAREVRPPSPESGGEVACGRPRLLLGLEDRVEDLDPPSREAPGVNPALLGRPPDEVDEPGEVRGPFARAEVDAEPRGVDLPAIEQPGLTDGLRRDRQCDPRVPTEPLPPRRLVPEVPRQVEPLQLGGDPSREGAGVEPGDRADPAAPLAEGLPRRGHVEAHRSGHAHPRHHHPPTRVDHRPLPPFPVRSCPQASVRSRRRSRDGCCGCRTRSSTTGLGGRAVPRRRSGHRRGQGPVGRLVIRCRGDHAADDREAMPAVHPPFPTIPNSRRITTTMTIP